MRSQLTPWAFAEDEVVRRWHVDPTTGLSTVEVQQRLADHGPNSLRKSVQKPLLSLIANQFKGLIVVLLAAAAGVSLAFGQWLEGIAVLVVLILNGAIGFFSEWRAVRSMEALQALGNVMTTVKRDGRVQSVPAEHLVPGDIVIAEGGDIVTADVRLLSASRLRVDESALTGESVTVIKQVQNVDIATPLAERRCMLFKGTAVTQGSADGIVVATGMQTELGEIADLVEQHPEAKTPLEHQLDRLARKLVGVTVAITVMVIISGVLTGKELLLMVQTGLALAIAAIPEGLPIVATLALAHGMRCMAERRALVNRLASVETLGSTSVICTDKTGTLTENQMTVATIALADGDIPVHVPAAVSGSGPLNSPMHNSEAMLSKALRVAVLCNDATLGATTHSGPTQALGDPMEIGLLQAAKNMGIDSAALGRAHPRVSEEAFDPVTRMMTTVHKNEDGWLVTAKGAPECILDSANRVLHATGEKTLGDDERNAWLARNETMAASGLRVLALAQQQIDNDKPPPPGELTLIGLVGLHDPPRRDIKHSIEQCRNAGIQIVMVTGDQAPTALGIARSVGLVDESDSVVLQGDALDSVNGHDAATAARLRDVRVFARVSPTQKLNLIDLHQQAGHVVAMTGDGVNDAPALRKADIGVAMGQRGTQVAREASDMVLQNDAFSTIVVAVREGRIIFANIRSFVFYLMSCNVGEVVIVAFAVLFGMTLPLLPLQILFLNLVTDVFPALALGLGPGEDDLMDDAPRPSGEAILDKRHWVSILIYGAAFTVAVLGALILAQGFLVLPVEQSVTVSFLTLSFAQLWHVFNMRSSTSSLFRNAITRNGYVWSALALCITLIVLAVFIPPISNVLRLVNPGHKGWILALSMSIIPLLVGQLLHTGRDFQRRNAWRFNATGHA